MNDKTFKALEFNKIISLISEHAYSDNAKEEVLSLLPTDNIYLISDKLNELDELIRFSLSFSSLPIYGYKVNKDIISRASKDGILINDDFINISKSIKCASLVKKHILSNLSQEDVFPTLEDYANNIEDLSYLQKEIDRVIIDSETISDKASSTLYDIRRNIKNTNNKIREKLNSIINSNKYQKYLSENIVTIRYSRYVVPVKSEYKGEVRGIVHDTSQSGATLFIEPEAIVNLNNKLKELEISEQKEIETILKILSLKIKENANSLKFNENILLYLDVLNAKADFCIKNEYSKPVISEDNTIDLKKARHPLIDINKVVPSNIVLNNDFKALIITGPNTGGKTVTLKTVGLCSLLMQCGLFIPANENSCLPVFENIFADIGDKQSIAQSLSTFSSHMTNIVDIVNSSNDKTLVLIDELGAGTDPVEGSALAVAIIDRLKNIGAKVFATTHYSEIKEYAITKKDVMNASVEFDVETLSPTYKLILGIPGKSNAFEISKKLGLDSEIIEKAKKNIKKENRDIEELIRELNDKTALVEKEKNEVEKLLAENEKLNDELTKEKEYIENNKSKIMLDASLKAKDIIADAKRESKEIINKLNKISIPKNVNANNDKYKKDIDKIKNQIKEKEELLNSYIPSHEIKKQENKQSKKEDFKVGQEVYIKSLDQYATILGFDNKNNVFIQAGIIKTKIPISKIEPSKREKEQLQKSVIKYSNTKAKTIKTSLDLRGMYADDAILKVEKYLDDAYLANLKLVTIIHGKGTGVLKKAVSELLKNHPYVKKYRLGDIGEGGDGATVVTLK
ncbi:endonuclease MutS2 [Anaerofustis butyriciformans]|uniref:endonuclease MutS2 n=1 Tax=Anaerofustis butyriciformans TaxID=3108533 RepID=UPI002E355264|nr:endonuclease MutS2 [Anaerofustis sp. HA2171]